jgi:histidinol-phosphate aminotransferase
MSDAPRTDPRLTPLAAALPASVPFVGPEEQERARGAPFAARLGANESGFGPSPAALEALCASATEAWRYGDPEMHGLRTALAAHLDVPAEAVIVGEGIDGLLGLVVRLTIAPGDVAVTSAGAYPTFAYHVTGFGGRLAPVPYRNDHEDLDALIAAAAAPDAGGPAKLLYLANPDNPMGTWHSGVRIAAALDNLPPETLMILDEAYAEFAPAVALPPLDPGDRRVLRMRTFSKAHGLAGLRVGYAVGHPDLIAAFDRVRNHFGLGRVAQAAAEASLADAGHLARTVDRVAAARRRIAGIATRNGLAVVDSATNFVAVDCGADGAFARRVLAELLARDVFVRMPGVAPLDRCIRVSCGPEADLAVLERALPDALAAARASMPAPATAEPADGA